LNLSPIRRWKEWIGWLWPMLACLTGWRFIALNLHAPLQWDARYTYLPAARALLEQGWAFILSPASCRVAPLGYLWPALWGADSTAIRIANMGLWAGCAWFLWRTACLLGGARAGAAAMLLLMFSGLRQTFPTELTEPVYLFGVFGLMHALARMVAAGERARGPALQGAAMLAITLLSRPILQWIAPAALLACLIALALHFRRGASRPQTAREPARAGWPAAVSRLALCLGLGLALALGWAVMNGLASGFWGLRTGAGVSLYLGTHPLSQVSEPAFLGFDFDDPLTPVIGGHDPLSPAAEPVARAAALWQIQSLPLPDAAAFFGRKLWWWLAEHPAEIARSPMPLRPVRLLELSALALAALWAGWGLWQRRRGAAASGSCAVALIGKPSRGQWALAALLLGVFALLLGQSLAVFYNSRYSVAMLDPWLIALAAFALSLLTAPAQWRGGALPRARAAWTALAALALVAALAAAVCKLAARFEHLHIDPAHMGAVAERLRMADAARIDAIGMTRQTGPQGQPQWLITARPAVFMVRVSQAEAAQLASLHGNALWDTEIALRPPNPPAGRCRDADVAWQNAAGDIVQPEYKLPLRLPLAADGQFQHLVTHANAQLRPAGPGSLRITLDCPIGAAAQWRQTRFLESRQAVEAAGHVALSVGR
jgi:hypothetical protein